MVELSVASASWPVCVLFCCLDSSLGFEQFVLEAWNYGALLVVGPRALCPEVLLSALGGAQQHQLKTHDTSHDGP